MAKDNVNLPNVGNYATGIIFLPTENSLQREIINIIKSELEENSLSLLHIRDVPTNPKKIGKWSKEAMPNIKQIFIENNSKNKNNIKDLIINNYIILQKIILKMINILLLLIILYQTFMNYY